MMLINVFSSESQDSFIFTTKAPVDIVSLSLYLAQRRPINKLTLTQDGSTSRSSLLFCQLLIPSPRNRFYSLPARLLLRPTHLSFSNDPLVAAEVPSAFHNITIEPRIFEFTPNWPAILPLSILRPLHPETQNDVLTYLPSEFITIEDPELDLTIVSGSAPPLDYAPLGNPNPNFTNIESYLFDQYLLSYFRNVRLNSPDYPPPVPTINTYLLFAIRTRTSEYYLEHTAPLPADPPEFFPNGTLFPNNLDQEEEPLINPSIAAEAPTPLPQPVTEAPFTEENEIPVPVLPPTPPETDLAVSLHSIDLRPFEPTRNAFLTPAHLMDSFLFKRIPTHELTSSVLVNSILSYTNEILVPHYKSLSLVSVEMLRENSFLIAKNFISQRTSRSFNRRNQHLVPSSRPPTSSSEHELLKEYFESIIYVHNVNSIYLYAKEKHHDCDLHNLCPLNIHVAHPYDTPASCLITTIAHALSRFTQHYPSVIENDPDLQRLLPLLDIEEPVYADIGIQTESRTPGHDQEIQTDLAILRESLHLPGISLLSESSRLMLSAAFTMIVLAFTLRS
jgi:hypothetical protein